MFCHQLASDVEQPVYENLIPINYERQDRAAMHTNNLKENGDDVSLREDNIYYAHVSYFIKLLLFLLGN